MLHTCFSTHPFVFKLHLIYSVCMLHNVIKQRNVMRVFILLFGNNYCDLDTDTDVKYISFNRTQWTH